MSINKFVVDVQTGKLLTVQAYDRTAIASRRIVKTRIDWEAIWHQPTVISFSIIIVFTVFNALTDGNWAAVGLALTLLIAIVGITLKLFTVKSRCPQSLSIR